MKLMRVLFFMLIAAIFLCAPQAFAVSTGEATTYIVKIAKVELYDGSSYVTVYDSESVGLDIASSAVTGLVGNFLAGLNVPDGTYTRVRVTPSRTFTITGNVTHTVADGGDGVTKYYTTAAVAGASCTATQVAGNVANATITVAAVNASTQDLSEPVKVTDGAADHKIRVSFNVANALTFQNTGPGTGVMYPQEPTVAITLIKNE